jgi:hypothetical protein
VILRREKTTSIKNKKTIKRELVVFSYFNTCGESRIRTCEDVVSRFTVCPRWPLEYLPDAGANIKTVLQFPNENET